MNLRHPETIVKHAMPEQTPELSGTDWLILCWIANRYAPHVFPDVQFRMGLRRSAADSAKSKSAMEPARFFVYAPALGVHGRDAEPVLPAFANALVCAEQDILRT